MLRLIVKHWRHLGYFVVIYLDDGWGTAGSKELCSKISQNVKADLLSAGLVPNTDKSVWNPTQKIPLLGLTWNTELCSLMVTDRRIQDLLHTIGDIQTRLPSVSARKLASVTGKIISLGPVVGTISQLKTRFLHLEIEKRVHWDHQYMLKGDSKVIKELVFWRSNIVTLNKRLLFEYSIPQVVVYTNASHVGCGAWTSGLPGEMVSQRNWNENEQKKSSTWRETKAVYISLQALT